MGDPDIYVTNDGLLPDAQHFGWHAVAAGEDAVTMDAHDPGWCSGCEYLIGVTAAQRPANFSVVAATHGAVVVLEDGVPHLRSLQAGEAHYYRVYIPSGDRTDVQVAVTPLSGEPDLYASTTVHRPNASIGMHSYSAATVGRDTISIEHTDEELMRCVHHSPHCVLYVAVYGRAAGTYTVVASLDVVDSGLTVNSPASLAGNYVFSSAAFGPPLPVIGTPRPLAVASPWEACTEVTPNLSGKIALIGRGTCDFIEKTLHAQAAGAVAVVIVNTDSDGVINMAGTSEETISIPTVMVSHEDGQSWKIVLSNDQAVMLTLYSSVNRPTELRNGVPQDHFLQPSEIKYFSFSVSGASRVNIALTSSITPFDADLYVSTDGTLPSSTHYGFKSTSGSSDALTLRLGDSGFVSDGVYILGIVNAGSGGGVFELVASTDFFPVYLREGYPMYDQVDFETPAYFRFSKTEPDTAVRVLVTKLSGDPDICIVRNQTRLLQLPSLLGRWWERGSSEQAAAFFSGVSLACEWSSTLQGSDVLTIPHTDPHGGLGDYYVAILGTNVGTNSFHIVVQTADDSEVVLVGGRPQQGTLQPGAWNYYRLDVGPDTANVTITVTPRVGDPDIFVNTNGQSPGRQSNRHIAFTDGSGIDTLVLHRNSNGFNPPAQLNIGVFAWAFTSYSIIVNVAQGACSGVMEECHSHQDKHEMTLQEGVPLASSGTGYTYFEFDTGSSANDVQLVLTTLVGQPELYGAYSSFPTADSHDLSVGTVPGIIALAASSPSFSACRAAASSCVLHASVFCASECAFTLLGRSSSAPAQSVVLVDGQPQHAVVASDEFIYFAFSVSNATEVSFAITADEGTPEMYVATEEGTSQLPSRVAGSFKWSIRGSSSILSIDSSDMNFCSACRYLVGVVAHTHSIFSITATRGSLEPGPGSPPSPPPPVRLQDGVPVSASTAAGQCKNFAWLVPQHTAASPVLFVTPFSGLPSVYVNFQSPNAPLALPNKQRYGDDEWPNAMIDAALGQLQLSIPSSYVSMHVGTYNVVACASASASASFALTALADGRSPTQLVAGRSQEAAVSSGSWRFFRFQVPSDSQKVVVTTNLFAGGVDVFAMCGVGDSVPSRSPSDYTWTGRRIVLSPATPGFCGAAVYLVGVRGTTSARFNLMYTLDEGLIALQQGTPTSVLTAQANEVMEFTYNLDSPAELTIIVTPMSGDPNVYVSTNPNPLSNHQWSSELRERTDIIHIDALHVSSQTYYIAVKDLDGASCSFTVLVTLSSTRLTDGQPQNAVVNGGEWAYFTFAQEDVAKDILIAASSNGNPDVYVNAGPHHPTKDSYDWRSAVVGAEQMILSTSDTAFCTQCIYTIGVTATEQTPFTIIAQSAESAQLLQLGKVSFGSASLRPSYFELDVAYSDYASVRTIQLILSSLSGGAFKVGVSTTDPRPNVNNLVEPAPVIARAGDEVTLSVESSLATTLCRRARLTTVSNVTSDKCIFYFVVQPIEEGLFTVVARQLDSHGQSTTWTKLLHGTPQFGSVALNQYEHYKLQTDGPFDISISITPIEPRTAQVDLFVSTSESVSATNYVWKSSSSAAETLLISGDSSLCAEGCTYYIAVLGHSEATFSLVGASTQTHTTLSTGTVIHSRLDAGQYDYYRVPRGTDGNRIEVETCRGSVRLYESQKEVRPRELNFEKNASDGDVKSIYLAAAATANKPAFISVLARRESFYVIKLKKSSSQYVQEPSIRGRFTVKAADDGERYLISVINYTVSEGTVYQLYGASGADSEQFSTPCALETFGRPLSEATASGEFEISRKVFNDVNVLNILATSARNQDSYVHEPYYAHIPSPSGGIGGFGIFFILCLVLCFIGGGAWLVREWRAGQQPIAKLLRPVRARLAPITNGRLTSDTRRESMNTELLNTGDYFLTAPLGPLPPMNPHNPLTPSPSSTMGVEPLSIPVSTSNSGTPPERGASAASMHDHV